MRRIAVINQKGGVGKTTTTVNLGAALARLGQRVLVCDLDPQCNLTVHLDADPASEAPSLYELLHGTASLAQVVRPTRQPGLDLAPASIDLAGIELELVNAVGRETLLRDTFAADEASSGPRWDLVLMDCPPSLGLLSLNALVACNEVFVPIQAEFFALQGLGKLHEVVELVQRRLNPALAITGMVSCRHDPSTNLGRQVMADIADHFGDVLFRTVIRRNVKLAEAPSHGRSILEYDPESRGAQDYLQLAQELLDRHAARNAPPARRAAKPARAVAAEAPASTAATAAPEAPVATSPAVAAPPNVAASVVAPSVAPAVAPAAAPSTATVAVQAAAPVVKPRAPKAAAPSVASQVSAKAAAVEPARRSEPAAPKSPERKQGAAKTERDVELPGRAAAKSPARSTAAPEPAAMPARKPPAAKATAAATPHAPGTNGSAVANGSTGAPAAPRNGAKPAPVPAARPAQPAPATAPAVSTPVSAAPAPPAVEFAVLDAPVADAPVTAPAPADRRRVRAPAPRTSET